MKSVQSNISHKTSNGSSQHLSISSRKGLKLDEIRSSLIRQRIWKAFTALARNRQKDEESSVEIWEFWEFLDALSAQLPSLVMSKTHSEESLLPSGCLINKTVEETNCQRWFPRRRPRPGQVVTGRRMRWDMRSRNEWDGLCCCCCYGQIGRGIGWMDEWGLGRCIVWSSIPPCLLPSLHQWTSPPT